MISQVAAAELLGMTQPGVALAVKRKRLPEPLTRRSVEEYRQAQQERRKGRCAICGREFTAKARAPRQKYCGDPECLRKARHRHDDRLTQAEVARRLGTSREWVRQLVASGRLVTPLTEETVRAYQEAPPAEPARRNRHVLTVSQLADALGWTVRDVREARKAGTLPRSVRRDEVEALRKDLRKRAAGPKKRGRSSSQDGQGA